MGKIPIFQDNRENKYPNRKNTFHSINIKFNKL